jgi:hypothetical protein
LRGVAQRQIDEQDTIAAAQIRGLGNSTSGFRPDAHVLLRRRRIRNGGGEPRRQGEPEETDKEDRKGNPKENPKAGRRDRMRSRRKS